MKKEHIALSRRNVLKGMAVIGSSIPVINFGTAQALPKESQAESKPQIYYASCVHNCGAGVRCISKLHVVDEKVVRVTSDESDFDFEGGYRDKEQYNDSRSLSCPKGRSYKYRLYHPGRVKYALKQTKTRGDMTGFVRIDSQQAMKEVAQKYRAIYTKYGASAIYNTYGTSANYGGTFSNCADARLALTSFIGGVRTTYSDYSYHQYNYANVLTGHPGINYAYAKENNIGYQLPHVAGVVKNVVSWGTNVQSTNNTIAYPYARAIQKMKDRYPQAKVYFIGPEFVDTGVSTATDWVQLRNYTDTALIMAMFHEMIINTFDKNGKLKENPWLDVNYLDTMVYGFFDSPAHYINLSTGEIYDINDASAKQMHAAQKKVTGSCWQHKVTGALVFVAPEDAGKYNAYNEYWELNDKKYAYQPVRKVDAVEGGKSLSSYVMGSDNRLTKAKYADAANYTAQAYGKKQKYRNASTCSYNVRGIPANKAKSGSSQYLYKQNFLTPKTPEWAEQICGTPAKTIRELAKMYCDPTQHPIFNEWCGGLQKQENGVVNLFAIASLLCVTKTFGMYGEGLYGPWASTILNPGDSGSASDFLSPIGSIPANRPALQANKYPTATVSVKEWNNGIKLAFHDVLKKNGYSGKRIPEWDGSSRYIYDDGGAKAGIKLKYSAPNKIATYTDPETGLEYYDYEGREANNPVFSGTRMIIISGGGIQVNQHANSFDNTEMYKNLPLAGNNPNDPDTYCMVSFDPYLSPTARYADYVFPATIALEAGDWMNIGGQVCYRPAVSKAPGDVKDGWTYAYEAYKAQAELGNFKNPYDGSEVDTKNVHLKYVGSDSGYQPSEVLSMKIVDKARNNPDSRFYKMSREEVFASQYRPRKNQPELITKVNIDENSQGGPARMAVDKYLALSDEKRKVTPFTHENRTVAKVADWGNGDNIAESKETRPEFTGKFQVYNNTAVWDYERRFSKFHGWLPKEQRGQKNTDYENDPIVYPIPLYFYFEDCFNEMYGVFAGKTENDLSKKGGLTMSTTHDRYRVHSTHDENPLMRELNHRTKGGGWASGNDWKEYAVFPDNPDKISAMLSSAILNENPKTASWHEVWINVDDAAERNIKDGDLVRVENPIGAVRVIARVTARCMRGHINLHQGGWFDPNPVDGVDDGGCANTLMSSKPSRYDNGNAQQMAYVTVRKETEFMVGE